MLWLVVEAIWKKLVEEAEVPTIETVAPGVEVPKPVRPVLVTTITLGLVVEEIWKKLTPAEPVPWTFKNALGEVVPMPTRPAEVTVKRRRPVEEASVNMLAVGKVVLPTTVSQAALPSDIEGVVVPMRTAP